MRLLIVTQAVDTEDPVLGFFVRWIEELAKRFERVEVICLKEGKHKLPGNVAVHSLGKEKYAAENTPISGSVFRRAAYTFRFLSLVWRLRCGYDAVFVHMNQEYILIAGWLWKLLGKRIYMWRNHYAGSWLTDVAASFCTKVFCTSKHSYTAKYRKTELMPVGVDTERFTPEHGARKHHSILFLARMAPSKRPEILLDALAMLARDGVHFTASFVGSPLPQDASYYEGFKARAETLGFGDSVSFHPAVPNAKTPELYRAHQVFVNTSPSGMLDKTLFEAAACGCRVLSTSADFAELAGPAAHFDTATELAEKLRAAPAARAGSESPAFIAQQSLTVLASKLFNALSV